MHVILGGGGFVGNAVAEKLIGRGQRVRLVSRHPAAKRLDWEGRCEWRSTDIADCNWLELLEGATVVHYYAWSSVPSSAREPDSDWLINVLPLLKLLSALASMKCDRPRVVFASSGGTVYGRPKRIPIAEDHELLPIGTYGASKAAAECYISFYREHHHIDIRTARIANPYGPGQRADRSQGAVAIFIDRALKGLPITVWGDGSAIRDYAYIDDIASALIMLAEKDDVFTDHTMNLGSGVGHSVNQVISAIEQVVEKKLIVDYQLGRPFDVPANVLDISLATRVLCWRPLMDFNSGLIGTVSAHQDLISIGGIK